jgi:hypothetical protein
MLRLLRHVVVDVHHQDELVHHPVLQDRCSYTVKPMPVHQYQYVEENLHLLVDEILVVWLQNLDVLNLDVDHSFLDVVHLLVAALVEELRHLMKMDYYLGEVDEELRHLLKMDYYLGEALVWELH